MKRLKKTLMILLSLQIVPIHPRPIPYIMNLYRKILKRNFPKKS